MKQLLDQARSAYNSGQFGEAEKLYQRVISQEPTNIGALHDLGVTLKKQGKVDQAIGCYQKVIQLKPSVYQVYNSLANALKDKGEIDEAIQYYRQAITLNPQFVEAYNNLGIALQSLKTRQGFEEASACYKKALALQSNNPETFHNIGSLLEDVGKSDEAAQYYYQATQFNPQFFQAYNSLGSLLKSMSRIDEAIQSYRQAVRVKPDFLEGWNNLGHAYEEIGKVDEAVQSYDKALGFKPGNLLWRLRRDMVCPPIASDNASIDAWRTAALAKLEDYRKIYLSDYSSELAPSLAEPSFYSAYHGRNNRALRERYADLFAVSPDQLLSSFLVTDAAKAVNDSKIDPASMRVAFLVTKNHEVIFAKIIAGILNQWGGGPEISIVCPVASIALLQSFITNSQVKFLPLPPDFPQMVETIKAAKFDLIYFWEIGTDSTNYFLPFFRLAPVQCTSWGSAETSGIPDVDYFISSEAQEPENAEAHYSETLVKLPSLPVYFVKPVVNTATRKGRQHFGLPENRTLYFCPQSLFKLHPDMDALFAGILRADPQGQLVLVETRYKSWTEQLMQRLQRTMPESMNRVTMLPRQNTEDYFSLMLSCDVMLDSVHFGGGNTSLEALAFGMPIVTLPGQWMRGRFTYAAYKSMRMMECVAKDEQDYITIAVKLGTDKTYRQSIRDKILTANAVLYENQNAVEELKAFFIRAIQAAPAVQQLAAV